MGFWDLLRIKKLLKHRMVRIKRGNIARKRRKKILMIAGGYRGAHSVLFRIIWITRINAASRIEGITYSCFINNLNKAKITLNRKMLSQIAILDNSTFVKITNL